MAGSLDAPEILPDVPPRAAQAALRISDAERDRAIHVLRERFADGCMTQDTFIRRVEAALAARDSSDLAELLADLPPPARPGGALRAGVETGIRAGAAARAAAGTAVRAAMDALSRWVADADPRPPARLVFPAGDAGRYTIGRDSSCDLVLPDAGVSRWHAGLRRDAGGWLLADLGSTNGTRINGWRIAEPVRVHPGDVVTFGTATFLLCAAPAAAR